MTTHQSTLPLPARAATHGFAAIAVVYLAAFTQGLTLVSFPALSSTLREIHGFSEQQYGAIFLPQVAFAVAGALAGGALARRIGMKTLLVGALLANAFSQLALAWSATQPPVAAYLVILAGTGAVGLGFGLLGAPVNGLPALLFPARREAALVAAHSAIGLGLTLGPVYASVLMAHKSWLLMPLTLLGLAGLLAVWALFTGLPREPVRAAGTTGERHAHPVSSGAFWLFVAIAVLYAFAEGTFSNWAVVYLSEVKSLPSDTAALALAVFWGALVGGRLLASALLLKFDSRSIWRLLPVLMAAAFLLLPLATGEALAVALFGFAGLACSAFFPLTIALASQRFARDVAWVSSMLTAALMVGVGVGSFAVGALRMALPLDALYRLSSLYPIAALALIFLLGKSGTAQGAKP